MDFLISFTLNYSAASVVSAAVSSATGSTFLPGLESVISFALERIFAFSSPLIHAFALFCKSRPSKERVGAKEIETLAKELLKEMELISNEDFLDELRKDGGLLTKLDDLMLAIQVLEKSLIYARFHAKAMNEASE